MLIERIYCRPIAYYTDFEKIYFALFVTQAKS